MDCPDPEEILRKIPELADDLEEPDDCFTEGTRGVDLLMLMLIRVRISPRPHQSTSVCRTMAWHP